MADELEENLNQPSEAEKRIKQLSGKVKEEAEAKDAERVAREAAEGRAADAEKKAAFAEAFSDIVASNPDAKDFKADIQAKVMSGYTAEDAAFAVLGKAGKLGNSDSGNSTAGGSAATSIPQGGQKTVQEMTQAERLSALREAEQRGDISMQ